METILGVGALAVGAWLLALIVCCLALWVLVRKVTPQPPRKLVVTRNQPKPMTEFGGWDIEDDLNNDLD